MRTTHPRTVLFIACAALAALLAAQALGVGVDPGPVEPETGSASHVARSTPAPELERQAVDTAATDGDPSRPSLWDYHLGQVSEDSDVASIRRQLERSAVDDFAQAGRLQTVAERTGELDDLAALLRQWYYAAKVLAVQGAFERGEYLTVDRATYEKLGHRVADLVPDGQHMFAMTGSYAVGGSTRGVVLYFPIDLEQHRDVGHAWDAYQDLDQASIQEKVVAFNLLPLDERKVRIGRHHAARRSVSGYLKQTREAGATPDLDRLRSLRDGLLPGVFIIDRVGYTVRGVGRR